MALRLFLNLLLMMMSSNFRDADCLDTIVITANLLARIFVASIFFTTNSAHSCFVVYGRGPSESRLAIIRAKSRARRFSVNGFILFATLLANKNDFLIPFLTGVLFVLFLVPFVTFFGLVPSSSGGYSSV